LEQTQRISRQIWPRMRIYHIEIHRFMDTYCSRRGVHVSYTFQIRTAFQRDHGGQRINLGGKTCVYKRLNKACGAQAVSQVIIGDQAKA
jgi:hypothetical protein